MSTASVDPGNKAYAVTVSDSTNDANGPFRSLYVGAAGDVKVTMASGVSVTFTNVAAGSVLPIAILRVWSTGTTVPTPGTNIVGIA